MIDNEQAGAEGTTPNSATPAQQPVTAQSGTEPTPPAARTMSPAGEESRVHSAAPESTPRSGGSSAPTAGSVPSAGPEGGAGIPGDTTGLGAAAEGAMSGDVGDEAAARARREQDEASGK